MLLNIEKPFQTSKVQNFSEILTLLSYPLNHFLQGFLA